MSFQDLLLQQIINGVSLGAMYALLALGFTMVYGIIELINFAHFNVFMVGSFVALWLLQAMGIGGDVEGMTQIAQTDKDPEVRRHAVRNLGIFGGHAARATLVSIYNSQTDLGTKKEVINALFLSGSCKELVTLARKETDPELKKALIQKMSLISCPEITEYMMELLNK